MLVLSLLLLLLPSPPTPPRSDAIGALERDFDVHLGEGAWTDELVGELRAGFDALPPGLRRPPGGTLELVLHPQAQPFGLGDGTDEHPEWTGGRRTFHLYAFDPSNERRATLRLEALTSEDRERLWRRRAVVHAVMQRWDDALHVSAQRAWRDIDGWLEAFDRPLTFGERTLSMYAGAFSRARGMASASLDFVTFAEEALVPVEALAPDALPRDDQVACQEFTKSRVLGAFLAEHEPPGTTPPLARGPCPLFDEWASVDTVDHFEVLFAAPSNAHPESVFGHVSVRLVRRPGPTMTGPSFESVFEMAALTSPKEPEGHYLAAGLTGGFRAVFSTNDLASVLKTDTETDQRTVRRYRLNLAPDETPRLLERLWELERRGYFDYYFLTDNCGAMLVFLLNGVLDGGREIKRPGSFWVMPAAALDRVSAVDASGAPGLLTYVPGDFESSTDSARRASQQARHAMDALVAGLPADIARDWAAERDLLDASSAAVRRGAYDALPRLMRATFAVPGPSRHELVADLVAASARLERAATERAWAAKEKVELGALRLATNRMPDTDTLVRERQASFERERPEERRAQTLEQQRITQELLETATRRPYTPAEKDVLAAAVAQADTLTAALDAEATLGELAPDVDLARQDERAREQTESAERDAAARALPDSGADRVAAVPGVLRGLADSQLRPGLRLRGAALDEELGEQRREGIGAQSQLRLLDDDLVLGWRAGRPDVERNDLSLIAFRTLSRPAPQLRHGLLDAFGWGLDFAFASRPERPSPQRVMLLGEIVTVLEESERRDTATVLAFGAGPDARATTWPDGLGLTGRVALVSRRHLFGAFANALQLDASYLPRLGLLGKGQWRVDQEVRAALGVRFVVGARFALGPELDATWAREGTTTYASALAGLALELP